MNWGKGLLIAIIISVIAILILVYLTARERIDLVTEEYYPEELIYEQEIQKMKNANELPSRVIVEVGNQIRVQFPELQVPADSIRGNYHFYRPSDKDEDFFLPVRLDSGYTQIIDLDQLEYGKYEISIDWNDTRLNYLQKEVVFIDK